MARLSTQPPVDERPLHAADAADRIAWHISQLVAQRERRLLHMLVASITDRVVKADTTLQHAVDLLLAHPQVRSEMLELFDV